MTFESDNVSPLAIRVKTMKSTNVESLVSRAPCNTAQCPTLSLEITPTM